MQGTEFEIGKMVDIADLDPTTAIAIFGKPLYEAWMASKSRPRIKGAFRVSKVDRAMATLTLDAVVDDLPRNY